MIIQFALWLNLSLKEKNIIIWMKEGNRQHHPGQNKQTKPLLGCEHLSPRSRVHCAWVKAIKFGFQTKHSEADVHARESKLQLLQFKQKHSLRQQLTFHDATTGFPAKCRLRTSAEIPYWQSITTKDLGRATHWSCCMGNSLQLVTSTAQIQMVTHHQYGISMLISAL